MVLIQKLTWMWKNRNSPSLLVGMRCDPSKLKHYLEVFYKAKHSRCITNCLKNNVHTKTHINAYKNFYSKSPKTRGVGGWRLVSCSVSPETWVSFFSLSPFFFFTSVMKLCNSPLQLWLSQINTLPVT